MTAPVLTLSIPHFPSSYPRAKRNRLDRSAQALAARRPCSVASCTARSLVMCLVDSELEALLYLYHQLVQLVDSPVVGEAMLGTSGVVGAGKQSGSTKAQQAGAPRRPSN